MAQKLTTTKWEGKSYGPAKSIGNSPMTRVDTEMKMQPGASQTQGPNYVDPKSAYIDMGTQTAELGTAGSRRDTVPDNQMREELGIGRAPLPSYRSNTFPLKASNCQEACCHQPPALFTAAPLQKSSRPSRVMWTGVDQEIQTAVMEPDFEPEDEIEPTFIQEQPSFPSSAVPGERTRTFPFATTPSRRMGPYEAPRLKRSPNRSLDEGHTKWKEDGRELLPTHSQAKILASKRHSQPPLCTQCAGPLDAESKPESALLPQQAFGPPFHVCTRASFQCPQCFPSSKSSIAISPLEPKSPVEARAPVQAQYFPTSRRSTRPIIPVGPFEYPEALHRPASGEYARQEPMADPMKRPSVPRHQHKPVNNTSPKHVHCYTTASRPQTLPSTTKASIYEKTPYPGFASTVLTISNDTCLQELGKLNEKQVFKGLNVATAAACDEDIDKWIEEVTGSSARKFLSSLSAFDGLGVNTLSGVARRAAKQRREKLKAWEATREKRLAEQDAKPRCEVEGRDEVDYIIGDQDVRLDSRTSQDFGSEERAGNEDFMVHDQGVKKREES